ncbi:DUF2225 domain-containing protein [Bacillota bacterium LX-D]|nr:DUF2225 domain-containing protein [Bacillota bacterium LX-D]
MSDLDRLKKFGVIKKFNEGEYIFYEGEEGKEMYIILSGKVEMHKNSLEDYPVKIADFGPGDFFGEMALIGTGTRFALAIAKENTIALTIEKDNFLAFIVQEPDMALRIMQSLCQTIKDLTEELLKYQEGTRGLSIAEVVDNAETGELKIEAVEKIAETEELPTQETVPVSSHFFPPGHKIYGRIAPLTDREYLRENKITCPICQQEFTAQVVRTPKLRISKVELDFRKRYQNFEALWYAIWICPHCSYADFAAEFERIPPKVKKLLQKNQGALKVDVPISFSNPRTIDEAFTSYYLALHAAELGKAESFKFAKLWLRLSWLYQDVSDSEMFAYAAKQALDYYYQAYYQQSKVNLTAEQEQQICLILGELYLINNDKEMAVKHFYAAINRTNGNSVLNRQAQDRIYALKKSADFEEQEN